MEQKSFEKLVSRVTEQEKLHATAYKRLFKKIEENDSQFKKQQLLYARKIRKLESIVAQQSRDIQQLNSELSQFQNRSRSWGGSR